MQVLERAGFTAGQQYRVVTISFDATERIDQAARKQASIVAQLGHAVDWPFWVGGEPSVEGLTKALGFHFLRDARTGQLAHAAGIFVTTPVGTISR
jgi:protein SCO1/2